MKKTRLLILMLVMFIGIVSIKIPTYASEKGHTTISGQSVDSTGGKTDIIDNNTNTALIDKNVPNAAISDAPNGPSLSNSFLSQRYWLGKIPDEILPTKIKGYIVQAVNSYTIFAAVIIVIVFLSLGVSALDEQKVKYALKAIEILFISIIVMNLISPIIHLGLWIAGAL